MTAVNRPSWDVPQNMEAVIAATDDSIWETDAWSPINLTVTGGVTYRGREVPLMWQIEFEPFGPEFDAANSKVATLGLPVDGYGWASMLAQALLERAPELVPEVNFLDSEVATCVAWTESEVKCRQLIEIAWDLIFSPGNVAAQQAAEG